MIRFTFLTLTVFISMVALPLFGSFAIASESDQGFIYGKITTTNNKEYVGFLRWDDEEVCWDDLFHSSKEELPYLDEYEDLIDDARDDNRRGRRGRRNNRRTNVKVFNWSFSVDGDYDYSTSRLFIARFGDIALIEPAGSEGADITMKNGSRYEVSGYANDVGGKIYVEDDALGQVGLRWKRIESIEFHEAPRSADSGVTRLYGTVDTDSGDYEGFIQWDKEEALDTDILDGEAEDGDVELKMGRIDSIERRGSSGCIVTLNDGRSMRLRGSNDVNSDNRGIVVEDERFGRVTIPWDEFNELKFTNSNNGSGRGYDDFEELGVLRGTAIDRNGRKFTGRIVFDADESEAWEIFNGSYHDIEYDIPFNKIRSIEPLGRDDARLVLVNGEELELEDSQDTSDRNAGILVFSSGDRDPEYIAWDDLQVLELGR